MAEPYGFLDLFGGPKEQDMELDNLVDLLQLDNSIPPLDHSESHVEPELVSSQPCTHNTEDQAGEPQLTHSAPAFTSTFKSEDLASEQDDDAKQQGRRRRNRNAKQQELNRLAQQRYRERKKQRYNEMAQSVETLACQLSQLQMLERENQLLRSRAQELETTIQKKDIQVKQHQEQLKATQQTLSRQVSTMREQQAAIARQDRQLQEQALQVQALQQRLDGSIDQALLSLDPETASDKVVAAVKAAMGGSNEFRSLHPTLGQMPEALVHKISSTLSRCCAEMYLQLKQSGRSDPPAAIQVPCC